MADADAAHSGLIDFRGIVDGMNTDDTFTPGSAQDPHDGPVSGPDYSWNPIVGPGPEQHRQGSSGYEQSQPGYGSDPYGAYGPGPYRSGGYDPRAGYEQPAGHTAPTMLAAPPRRNKQRRGPLVLGAAVLAALVGAGAGIGAYAVSAENGTAGSSVTVTTAPAAQTATTDGTVAAAVTVINPSVVTITVQGAREADVGSGVILDTHGHIVTNAHVVSAAAQGAGSITVTLADGRTASASVVGMSDSNDLAVIKIDGGVDVSSLRPATFAKSSSVTLGQAVVAVGAPLGLSDTVTSGIVSATERPVRSGDNNDAVYLAVQTDTAINPGNSGGPLVNLNGAVVGINSSIASTSTGQQGQQPGSIGIGFAIPAHVVTRVAADLISSGAAPDASLGVRISANTSLVAQTTATGVTLQQVESGSPAQKAGLRAGDVVTKVNDIETTTADGLIAAIRYFAPGSQVTLTYTRNGSVHTTQVTLGQTS